MVAAAQIIDVSGDGAGAAWLPDGEQVYFLFIQKNNNPASTHPNKNPDP